MIVTVSTGVAHPRSTNLLLNNDFLQLHVYNIVIIVILAKDTLVCACLPRSLRSGLSALDSRGIYIILYTCMELWSRSRAELLSAQCATCAGIILFGGVVNRLAMRRSTCEHTDWSSTFRVSYIKDTVCIIIILYTTIDGKAWIMRAQTHLKPRPFGTSNYKLRITRFLITTMFC